MKYIIRRIRRQLRMKYIIRRSRLTSSDQPISDLYHLSIAIWLVCGMILLYYMQLRVVILLHIGLFEDECSGSGVYIFRQRVIHNNHLVSLERNNHVQVHTSIRKGSKRTFVLTSFCVAGVHFIVTVEEYNARLGSCKTVDSDTTTNYKRLRLREEAVLVQLKNRDVGDVVQIFNSKKSLPAIRCLVDPVALRCSSSCSRMDQR